MANDVVQVRKAETNDLDSIKALADANRKTLGFVLRATLAVGIQRNWMLVAESSNCVLIGFVHYRHRQNSQTTLYEICVHEAYRYNGFGRALIQALVKESTTLGKADIYLKAPINIPANEFYRNMGFTSVGVDPGKKRVLRIWHYPICRGDVTV